MNYYIQALYFWTLKITRPFIVFLGKLYQKSTNKEHIFKNYYEIENILKVGDVLLTKSDGHFSNLINTGYWKHALVFVGGDKPSIVEAIGEGVVKRTLIEMLASKDRLVILRPEEKLISTEKQMNDYVAYVLQQIGKKYDTSFDSFTASSEDAFYCSELVFSGIKHGNNAADFELRNYFGIMTVKPDDLYKMSTKGKFKLVLEINREKFIKFKS